MSDKHLAQFGLLADNLPTGYKDAMHVAVVRVVAGTDLYPGQKVDLSGIDRVVPAFKGSTGIGIVDPFLPSKVSNGDAFLLILYPGSTSNLRHVWDHPYFPDTSEIDSDNYDDSCRGCY